MPSFSFWENRSDLFSQNGNGQSSITHNKILSPNILILDRRFHPSYFAINDLPIPQPLPEVPTEAGEAIEEAKFHEIAEAEVGNGTEVARQFVVFRLARILKCSGAGQVFSRVERCRSCRSNQSLAISAIPV